MKTLTNQGAFNENVLRFDYTVDLLIVENLLLQTAQFVNKRIAVKLIARLNLSFARTQQTRAAL